MRRIARRYREGSRSLTLSIRVRCTSGHSTVRVPIGTAVSLCSNDDATMRGEVVQGVQLSNCTYITRGS